MSKKDLIINKYKIELDRPIGLKLVVVADLHDACGAAVIDVLKSISPDIILMPGDIVEASDDRFIQLIRDEYQVYLVKSGKNATDERIQAMYITKTKCPKLYFVIRILIHLLGSANKQVKKMIGKFKKEEYYGYGMDFLNTIRYIAPCYFSLGNHDCDFSDIPDGIKLLENEYVLLHINNREIAIGGMSRNVDPDWLDEFASLSAFHILLCHYPELYEPLIKDRRIELIVSGHAHGGQIRIRNKGLYAPGQGLFPKYTKGVYDNRLVVTTGLCNNGVIPRWGNPIEVLELEI